MEQPKPPVRIDALLPQEMAEQAERVGIRKCDTPFLKLFVLAMLAGAFIALGAIFSTTVATGSGVMPFGLARVLVGLAFCLGLALVVVGGAELFTGNNLIVMAWAGGKVRSRALLRNWVVAYAGNFVGSLATVLVMLAAEQHRFGDGAVGQTALNIAHAKLQYGFLQAVALGILCNALVCLAVWLTFSARTVEGRILAIIFPITAFVAAGFEHCVANMYFVPYALLMGTFDPEFVRGYPMEDLTWAAFLVKNLIPVTIGNIIGGSVLVAGVYWLVYLRTRR